MKRFLIALQFLTVLPVKFKLPVKEKDYGAALLYFPLVGLLIGVALSLSAVLLFPFPGAIRAAMILIISIILTGGIHLDGFADTCDGFYGNNPRERILEIMRDSRIGTMGAVGLISLLLMKFSLLSALPGGILWKTLILMGVFSRWAQVFACCNASYARADGKARYFVEYASKKELFIGFIFTLILFCLFFKLKGAVLFFVSIFPVFLFLQYIKKKINGVTGDTIGALSEIAETTVLLFAFLT